jgi:hypothetical protein
MSIVLLNTFAMPESPYVEIDGLRPAAFMRIAQGFSTHDSE